MAHRAGRYSTVVMVTEPLITVFIVLPDFTLSDAPVRAIPDGSVRALIHFGRSDRSGVRLRLASFLLAPHANSPTIFFGAILVVVSIGAFIPVLFGRETVGQLDTFTEPVPGPA